MKKIFKIILFCILTTNSFGEGLEDGLVAYYPFNGNANNQAGIKNSSIIVGNPELVNDRNGNSNAAYRFDGIDDYIDAGNPIENNPQKITQSVWIKSNATQNAPSRFGLTILTKRHTEDGSDWPSLTMSGLEGNIGFGHDDRGGDGGSSVVDNFGKEIVDVRDGKWHHVVGVKDGLNYYAYLDGEIIFEITMSGNTPNGSTRNLHIGHHGPVWNSFFKGSIDDVRIYDRALSSSEIANLYELEKPKQSLDDGLVAYYPFNGNANDESENGNNGTVNGATLTTDRNGNVGSAYNFDGDDFINFGRQSSLVDDEITISGWVKPSELGSGEPRRWISYGQDFGLELGNRGKEVWFSCGANFFTGIQHTDGWDHVSMTKDNTSIKIFLNGQLVHTQNSCNHQLNRFDLELGRKSQHWNGYWRGSIDDIRIYDRSLSSSEVSELYELEKPTQPDPSPPVVSFDAFYEALPDETITIDATPESGFPEDFTYQWYFGTFLIPEVLGGKSNTFDISSNDENNGVWTVKISNSAGSTGSSFYFAAYKDTDGDGISDGREEYVIGSDPTLADTDGDGLKDYDEVYTYGTSFSKPDTDGDGFDDIFEINTKYDPLNKESTPEAYLEIQTAVEIKFNAGKDLSYKIENSVDLENWNAIEAGVIGEGKLVKRLYSIDDYKGRYFRVRREN